MTKSRRLKRTYRQVLKGDLGVIFKLLCPVREKEWLRGWDYKMIYSESGLAEKGCVFETDNDFGTYLWVMTKYENFSVQFVKVMPGKMMVIIEIDLTDGGGEIVYCDISYTFTATSDAYVDQMHDENSEVAFNGHMKVWEDAMTYFLKTGQML